MKKILIFLSGLILLLFALRAHNYILFPSDILQNVRSYNLESWMKPGNSLISDPVFQFEPWRAYAKRRIVNGQFPLWNPNNGGGAPFVGNPQTSMLYPLMLFYYLLPVSISLNIIPISKIILYAVFCFLFLKSTKCSYNASVVGAAIATLSGFPILWLLWPHTNVFILLPLLLYLTEMYRVRRRQKFLFITSITYLIAILGGHPETLFYITIIHLLYAWYRIGTRLMFRLLRFVILGFMLGAFMIIPFLEYISNGAVLTLRTAGNVLPFFPLKSIVYNFFPLLGGAPQLSFYKPLGVFNFHELASGYVGIGILTLFVFVTLKLRANSVVRFFSYLTIFFVLVVYKIWPFRLITVIPPLNVVPNDRLIGFVGFFVSVVVSVGLSNINKIKTSNVFFKRSSIFVLLLALILIPLLIFIGLKISLIYPQYRNSFVPFLLSHIAIIGFSTIFIIYLYILGLHLKRLSLMYMGLSLALLIQVVPIFLGYNTVVSTTKYYPKNEIVETLSHLPAGRVIDVGNMYIPPSINLMYNIEQAQNEDAINVKTYAEEFNIAFPKKGYWNNVDEISMNSLNKFDIKYVISDYDINLKLVSIQPFFTQVIPVTKDKPVEYRFHAPSGTLKQVRVLTANFNRNNNCEVEMSIQNGDSYLLRKKINCLSVRDGTYLTVDTSGINLSKSDTYVFRLKWVKGDLSQFIGLRGSDDKPYLGLLYESGGTRIYENIWHKNSVYIWGVTGSSLLNDKLKYSVISDTPEKLVMKVGIPKVMILEVRKTYYPGWNAQIDGVTTKIYNTKPFMGIAVEKGVHILSLSYAPISFYVGLGISFLGILVLIVPYLRQIIYLKHTREIFRKLSIRISTIGFKTHFIVFCMCFAVSVALFVSAAYIIHPKFRMPETTAINWLTAHRYPKQQDLFYFAVGVPFIAIFTVILWLTYICKRKL